MSKTEGQEKAFQFLREKFDSQQPFTAKQFQEATGFSEVSFRTYLSKQYKGLFVSGADDTYRVSALFRRVDTWEKFHDNVTTQKRNLGRTYAKESDVSVIIFEFYMPLRNEECLRETLDSLFFKDTIKGRLRLIGPIEVQAQFSCRDTETTDEHLERVCQFVAGKIAGYSVQHVNGRYRAGKILTQQEGKNARRYLVDETTAVVRFILPCKVEDGETITDVAEQIRWCFQKLFVQAILEVVNAEDEVWLLESGMRHQLHIWRAETSN